MSREWLFTASFIRHLPLWAGKMKRSELFPQFPILMFFDLRLDRQLSISPLNTAKGIFLIMLSKNIL